MTEHKFRRGLAEDSPYRARLLALINASPLKEYCQPEQKQFFIEELRNAVVYSGASAILKALHGNPDDLATYLQRTESEIVKALEDMGRDAKGVKAALDSFVSLAQAALESEATLEADDALPKLVEQEIKTTGKPVPGPSH